MNNKKIVESLTVVLNSTGIFEREHGEEPQLFIGGKFHKIKFTENAIDKVNEIMEEFHKKIPLIMINYEDLKIPYVFDTYETCGLVITFNNWKNAHYDQRQTSEILFYALALFNFAFPYPIELNKDYFNSKNNSIGMNIIKNNFNKELMAKTSLISDISLGDKANTKLDVFQAYNLMNHDKAFGVVLPQQYVNTLIEEMDIVSSRINGCLKYSFYKFNVKYFHGQLRPGMLSLSTSVLYRDDLLVIILKPSTFRDGDSLKNVYSHLWKLKIVFKKYFKTIPKWFIQEFYPHCHRRSYGENWYSYLQDNAVAFLAIQYNDENELNNIRNLCLKIREASNIRWNRNVIHCSSSMEEAKNNIETLRTFLENKSKEDPPHKHYNDSILISREEVLRMKRDYFESEEGNLKRMNIDDEEC